MPRFHSAKPPEFLIRQDAADEREVFPHSELVRERVACAASAAAPAALHAFHGKCPAFAAQDAGFEVGGID
jgi:hypothetical protein